MTPDEFSDATWQDAEAQAVEFLRAIRWQFMGTPYGRPRRGMRMVALDLDGQPFDLVVMLRPEGELSMSRAIAAVKTLGRIGYEYVGGDVWEPAAASKVRGGVRG